MDGGETSKATIAYFDPDGDTRLLMNPGGEDEKIFFVSYDAMSRKSHPEVPISLPDDDPKGLAIIANIAHLHFDRLPHRLNFQTLLSVAVLTEKYGATKVVRPWYQGWMKSNRKFAGKAGYEEWLWIAWAFGDDKTFDTVTKRLVEEVIVDKDGKCVNAQGLVMDPLDDDLHFPPGIIETILDVRGKAIDSILARIYTEIDAYLEAAQTRRFRCTKRLPDNEACDACVFRSLFLGISSMGLVPDRKTASNLGLSLKQLVDGLGRLWTVSPLAYPLGLFEVDGDGFGHDRCYNGVINIQSAADQSLETISSPVLLSHVRHMKRKRAELSRRSTIIGSKRIWDEISELSEEDGGEAAAHGEQNPVEGAGNEDLKGAHA